MSLCDELNARIEKLFPGEDLLEYFKPLVVDFRDATQICPSKDEAFTLTEAKAGCVVQAKPEVKGLENALILRFKINYAWAARMNLVSDTKLISQLAIIWQGAINEVARMRNDLFDFNAPKVHFKYISTKDVLREMTDSAGFEMRLYVEKRKDNE